MMAGNSIGQIFKVTTFGESHGISLGCIVDGVPPNIEISEDDIQIELDRRKPGTSNYTTKRREGDKIKILSGVFNGKVIVDENTHSTNANQSNKNLLLSPSAIMNSNPQLEIYAEDVKCSHGSTTGQIDIEALFYLQSLI